MGLLRVRLPPNLRCGERYVGSQIRSRSVLVSNPGGVNNDCSTRRRNRTPRLPSTRPMTPLPPMTAPADSVRRSSRTRSAAFDEGSTTSGPPELCEAQGESRAGEQQRDGEGDDDGGREDVGAARSILRTRSPRSRRRLRRRRPCPGASARSPTRPVAPSAAPRRRRLPLRGSTSARVSVWFGVTIAPPANPSTNSGPAMRRMTTTRIGDARPEAQRRHRSSASRGRTASPRRRRAGDRSAGRVALRPERRAPCRAPAPSRRARTRSAVNRRPSW